MSQYEGKIVTVLCEGSSKKDENVLAGYTDKNKLVNFKGPRESIGKLVDVKIDEAKQYSLNGTFIQEHQRSMHTIICIVKRNHTKSRKFSRENWKTRSCSRLS